MESLPLNHSPGLAITLAPPGKLARKVIKRSNARCTGKYPSWKMGGMVHCESENERNCMLLLDLCPDALSYRSQPCMINYILDDRQCLHFPDILVTTRTGQAFLEVKTRKEANRPDTVLRTSLLSRQLPDLGYSYHLVLAEDLANPVRLANAEIIKSLGYHPITPLEREGLRTLFQQYESLPWGALQHDPDNRYLKRQVCRLVLEGDLHIDINQPLADETPVRWVYQPNLNGGASWESLICKKAL